METNVRDVVPCLDVFKKQAKRLTAALSEKTQLSHGQSLEVLAKTYGFRSWGEMKSLNETSDRKDVPLSSEKIHDESMKVGFFLDDLLPYFGDDRSGLSDLMFTLAHRKNFEILFSDDEYVIGELSKKFGHQRVRKAVSQMMSERSEKRRFEQPHWEDVDQAASLSLAGRPISSGDPSSQITSDHILCATTRLHAVLSYLIKNGYSINPRVVTRTVHHGLFQPLFWNPPLDNLEFVNPVTALIEYLRFTEDIKSPSNKTLIVLKLSDLMLHNRFGLGGTVLLAKLRSLRFKTLVLMDRKLDTVEMRMVMQVFGSVIE